MKKTLTIIAFSITGLVSFAQQDAQFSMNMFNRLAVNPGYAGTNQALCGTLLYRQQWVSFPGQPKTALVSVDYGRILNGGLGLTVVQDELGFEKTLNARLAYSYHLTVGPGILGLGLDVGMLQKGISGSFLAPDGTTSANGIDPSIPWTGSKKTTYDVGFGAYYTTGKLYVGLSALHLPEQKIANSNGAAGAVGSYNFDYTVARHYYVMAGYRFDMGQFSLTPGVLAKSDGSSTQVDMNLFLKWRNMVFVGTSYRLTDAIPLIAGVEWAPPGVRYSMRLGYAYDITLSNIKNHSDGSHELMLGYCYKFAKPPTKESHMNVRFL